MKQFNRIIVGFVLLWLLLAVLCGLWIYHSEKEVQDKEYLVEVNRIQELFTKQKTFSKITISDYKYMKQIDYLPVYLGENKQEKVSLSEVKASTSLDDRSRLVIDFFEGKDIAPLGIIFVPSGSEYIVKPFYIDFDLQGYIRYSFNSNNDNKTVRLITIVEGMLVILFLIVLGLLLYLRQNILKPFHEISDLPYELSKGHLSKEVKETKNRYFGKLLWGLELLRQNLEEHRHKELQLEKDKKLMILSISHDIKTPLSTIKLYSKALYEDLYTSEEKKHETAKKIEERADQIENFVTEIIKASSTELFEFDIVPGEFYLSQLMVEVRRTYEEKLNLLKITFSLMSFQDKLLVGDKNKLIDVFDNILQNAIKYGDGKNITISFYEEDNCQLIRIFNSGIPVPSSHLHHLYESFWRGENAIGKQGNGLGLYICKQLMRKMEGDIFAEVQQDGMSIILVLNKYGNEKLRN